MPVPVLQSGSVPEGRWVCTVEEVKSMFVAPGARAAIWQDWETLTSILKTLVGRIPAVWLSGSFVTDKETPGDIDCLYVVDTDDYLPVMNRSDADSQVLWAITTGQTKATLGFNVDSYILEWCPTPGPAADAPPHYYQSRGYWDDLWLRIRDSDPRVSSIPRRGYLEVVIDGYQ